MRTSGGGGASSGGRRLFLSPLVEHSGDFPLCDEKINDIFWCFSQSKRERYPEIEVEDGPKR